ncbi:MAG: isochorismatase family protein [Muribaculaceae bacterium]|nr:isochorismatase family protein [Muribaculaceae bacterium]
MTYIQNRMLLIVDPQIDFINGNLPVPGAEKAMDGLADYVREHGNNYCLICVTCDRHPLCHSSFKDFGGIWQSHCIESSVGAAVWQNLMENLRLFSSKIRFLYKGESAEKDEYSIFQNIKGAADINRFIEEYNISEIDICGIAGDVCVANTLQDALILYPAIKFHILNEYIASLDGGKKISTFIEVV